MISFLKSKMCVNHCARNKTIEMNPSVDLTEMPFLISRTPLVNPSLNFIQNSEISEKSENSKKPQGSDFPEPLINFSQNSPSGNSDINLLNQKQNQMISDNSIPLPLSSPSQSYSESESPPKENDSFSTVINNNNKTNNNQRSTNQNIKNSLWNRCTVIFE